MKNLQLFIGPIVHSLTPEKITFIPKGIVAVHEGKIVAVEETENVNLVKKKLHVTEAEELRLKNGQFLIPGFVDAHTHAPQFPNIGIGYDKPLLEWLDTYTFPLESKYKDEKFAIVIYSAVVERTLSHGTTTAAYFSTIHLESSILLAKIAAAAGQRALIGKVNMNMNCPSHYKEETKQSVEDTEKFIQAVLAIQDPLIQPVITPRFAITCDSELLSQLGKLAAKYNVHVQTHISENKEEVAKVKTLFPKCKSYADVYDKAQLLGRKTLLAHGVFLTEQEIELIKEKQCSVIHCPSSNINLQSGLCRVRNLLSSGVNVALGTDVAGGNNISILDAIRNALSTSITISFSKPLGTPLTYHEAFYMATMGGAVALDMENSIGNFTVGKDFDALLIDLKCINSPIDILTDLNLSEMVQKFLYVGDDRCIRKVYVKGRLVSEKIV